MKRLKRRKKKLKKSSRTKLIRPRMKRLKRPRRKNLKCPVRYLKSSIAASQTRKLARNRPRRRHLNRSQRFRRALRTVIWQTIIKLLNPLKLSPRNSTRKVTHLVKPTMKNKNPFPKSLRRRLRSHLTLRPRSLKKMK